MDMKATYRVLAGLVPVIVVLQATFIAFGLFGIGHWVEDGNDLTKSVMESDDSKVTGASGLMLHGLGAMAIVVVALALLVVSFFAKIEGGVKWAALILGDVVLQWVLAFAAFGAPIVGALHGINAFVLFGLGMMAAQAAARSMSTSAPARQTQSV
jgi:hypothetical protein